MNRPNTVPTNPNANAKCQKCLQEGHWTFDCQNERTYKARPTRSALLANPELKLPEAALDTADFEKERAAAVSEILAQKDSDEYTTEDDSDEYTTDSGEDSELENNKETEEEKDLANDGNSSSSFSSDSEEFENDKSVNKRTKLDKS